MTETALESKRGGFIVFVAIFLGPFVGAGAVAITKALPQAPLWAPLAALALLHWILTAQVARARATGPHRTLTMLVWSVGAVVADAMWFGVLLTLAAAVAGTP